MSDYIPRGGFLERDKDEIDRASNLNRSFITEDKPKKSSSPKDLYVLLDKKDKYKKVEADKKLETMFRVRFPYRALIDEEDLKVRGIGVNIVNGRRQKQNIDKLIIRMVTVKRMIYWFYEGIPMALYYAKDIKRLYELLKEVYDKYSIKYASMAKEGGDEFALKIDRFAQTIKELNSIEFKDSDTYIKLGDVKLKQLGNFHLTPKKEFSTNEDDGILKEIKEAQRYKSRIDKVDI